MMTYFNLTSSTSDRENFDQMIREDAEGMLLTLPFREAWQQDPDQYVEISWDNFMIVAAGKEDVESGEIEGASIVVDDFAEAQARYLATFPQAVREWQKEQMIDHLQEEMGNEEKGYVTIIEISPGGEKDGLGYGSVVIDIVSLETDGTQIAYRQSDDGQDGEWQIGGIEDAVEEALGVREQLAATEEEIAEMAAQAEILATLG